MPAPPKMMPTAAIIRHLTMEPLLKKLKTVMPTIIREKYSGGPNARATPARSGPMTVSATTAKVVPMNEAKAAMPRAGPARPLRAMG